MMLTKLRFFLIKLLAGKCSVVLNVTIIGNLHTYGDHIVGNNIVKGEVFFNHKDAINYHEEKQ